MVRRPVDCRWAISQSKGQTLVTERQILGNRLIVALSIRDIQVGQIIWVQEEHVH